MREAAGVIDLTAFQIFDIEGLRSGALDSVQRTCVAQCDVAVGKVIYTPVLDANGGFRSDLTVMRLGDDHFRVVTGGAHGPADRKWFRDHLVGEATLTDDDRRRLDHRPVGPEGARHPRLAHRRRRLGRGLPDAVTCREIQVGRRRPCWPRGSPTSASSAGSSTSPWTTPPRCGRRCSTPGTTHGTVPVGIGVYGTTGRIEKGYRAYGYELDGERTIVEAAHAAAQGQGRRLHRQGEVPRPARGSRPRRCCAR